MRDPVDKTAGRGLGTSRVGDAAGWDVAGLPRAGLRARYSEASAGARAERSASCSAVSTGSPAA